MLILIKWKFIKILLIILLKLFGYCKCLSTVVNLTPPPPSSSSSSSSSLSSLPRRMFNFTLDSSPQPFPFLLSTTPTDLSSSSSSPSLSSSSSSLLSSTNILPTPLSLILMKHNNYEQKQPKFNNESEFNLVKQFLNLNKNLTLQMNNNNNNYVPHINNLNISDINNNNSFSNNSNNYYHRPLSLKLNNSNNYYQNKKYNYPKIKNNYTEFFVTSPLTNKTKNYNKLIYQDINVDNLDDFSDDNDDIVDDDDDDDDGMGHRHDGDHHGDHVINHLDHSFHEFNVNNMYFGTENYTVITSQIGSTAMVPCSVHHIGEGVVTWIRRKDYHLLTVGLTTYSSDERYSTVHLQHSEDWTLQIKFVQLRDAGIYECQVSTHPPTSIFIQLNVVEARAEIIGPSEKYLKPGSPLRLVCKVMSSTEPPLYIFWYHNNRMINYDGGITVNTESDNRYSELVIASTAVTHSGNYSCVPNSAAAASIYVHIFNGENPAAIHHVGHGNKLNSFNIRNFLIVIFLIFMKQF